VCALADEETRKSSERERGNENESRCFRALYFWKLVFVNKDKPRVSRNNQVS
jgi:hypothetical protein